MTVREFCVWFLDLQVWEAGVFFVIVASFGAFGRSFAQEMIKDIKEARRA